MSATTATLGMSLAQRLIYRCKEGLVVEYLVGAPRPVLAQAVDFLGDPMIADSCAGRMSITALPPGFRRSRIWAQQLVIELANLFDRVLQFLIITQPSLNLGNSLPTHAELLSASAPVAYRQH